MLKLSLSAHDPERTLEPVRPPGGDPREPAPLPAGPGPEQAIGGGPKQGTGGLLAICLCQSLYPQWNQGLGPNILFQATRGLRSETIKNDKIPRPCRVVSPFEF